MAGQNSQPGFQQTQRAWAAYIRDPEVNPGPQGIEKRRLKIYRDLIFNNIESFLSSGFPILKSLMPEGQWQALVRDFIVKHQSHSPYFLEISQEFLTYLSDQAPPQLAQWPFALELAHYEWVELALDVSTEVFPAVGVGQADPQALSDEDLLNGRPLISPLLWRLSYQYPVHRIGPDYQPQTPPNQPTCLLVYRDREEQVRFLESNAVTLRLLQLLEDGALNTSEVFGQVARELGYEDETRLIEPGLGILRELFSLSILCGTRS
ncbi:MAG TPA: DUF2063 domain-containing protein [Porticoccaceae bacterium]|nr:DUF2063 domain-containing protein [Porticoccaceae bacterium]